MITIKLPYKSSTDFQDFLLELRRQYSSAVRFAFNRFCEKKTRNEVWKSLNSMKNIDLLDSEYKSYCTSDALGLFNKFKSKPDIIFGKKKNFICLIKWNRFYYSKVCKR